MGLQLMFDFSKLDALSANLHLMVDSPDKFDVAIRQPSRKVSRFIHAFAGCKRMGNKFLLSQFWTVVIAFHESFAADAKLSGNPGRLHVSRTVKNVYFRIADRFSNRNRQRVLLQFINRMIRRENRAFRRSIHMKELALSNRLQSFSDMLNRSPFPAKHNLAKR